MHKYFSNQRGFALILELLLATIVIAILAFIGLRIYKAKQNNSAPENINKEVRRVFGSNFDSGPAYTKCSKTNKGNTVCSEYKLVELKKAGDLCQDFEPINKQLAVGGYVFSQNTEYFFDFQKDEAGSDDTCSLLKQASKLEPNNAFSIERGLVYHHGTKNTRLPQYRFYCDLKDLRSTTSFLQTSFQATQGSVGCVGQYSRSKGFF
ncbi:hypothetical protein KY386_00195 [Candidatus Parcubacteria bacterium]|nr:hypothetical protein [Candidatus Parcubacteria bacterium]